MIYVPDNWVVIKIKHYEPYYKVLAGWSGGYTQGDSWRMNSGIVRVEQDDHNFYFYGHSGSSYQCRRTAYCLRKNSAYVWAQLQELHGDKVELMPEDTDWLNVDWIIK